MFIYRYETNENFSDIRMSSDGQVLTGLWFEGSKDDRKISGAEVRDLSVFAQTRRWLDLYFSGKDPGFTPDYKVEGATAFRLAVIKKLLEIPYGGLVSYGDIAKQLAAERGIPKISAQAVGGAVGWNPICLIIPCHRVVGACGEITGYGGGLENKRALLRLEGHKEY